MNIQIRLAYIDELEEIIEVEHIASQRFSEYGLFSSSEGEEDDAEETSYEVGNEQREGIEKKRLWVALTPDGKIVGFALAQVIDQEGHLREIDVLQDFGRRGIGRSLINTVIDWCHDQGYPTLTLTTFKHIPFNRPYYEKLGFRIIPDAELRGTLKDMAEKERSTFALERVPMRKVL